MEHGASLADVSSSPTPVPVIIYLARPRDLQCKCETQTSARNFTGNPITPLSRLNEDVCVCVRNLIYVGTGTILPVLASSGKLHILFLL